MATTTNYGWTTPDDTALVKDGAAAIRTLGSSVDTTTKALNPSTTLGDIEYRSSTANTNTRLGIGSTGQVLTVSGGVPAWSTPASSSASFTQLAATATTSGSTITVSGLSGYNTLWITWESVGTATNTEPAIHIRFNSDSGNNYSQVGSSFQNTSATASVMTSETGALTDAIYVGVQGDSAANDLSGGLIIYGANTTGVKVGQLFGSAIGTNGVGKNGNFRYIGSSVISSVSILTSSNTFDEGTIRVIGSVI